MLINLIVIIIILLIGMSFSDRGNINSNWKRFIIKFIKDPAIKNNYIQKYNDSTLKNRKLYIIIISIIYILQSGLRNIGVGADTYAYCLEFERVNALTWKQVYDTVFNFYQHNKGRDPGYLILQKVFQLVISDYQVFLIFIAVVFFTAFGYFIYKNTSKLADTIFAFVLYSCLFYFFYSVTGIRQTIATAGTLIGYEYIKKRKLIKFLVIIIIASTIHKSCLIFIPFYFIAPVKKVNLLLVSVLLFPICFIFSNIIATTIQSIAESYSEYGHNEELLPLTFTVMILLVGVFTSLFYKQSIKKNPQVLHYFNAFAMAVFFTSQIFAIHTYMRIVQYFSIFMLLLIPIVFQSFENQLNKTRQFLYGVCVFTLISMSVRANWAIDYKFCWQNMELKRHYRQYK